LTLREPPIAARESATGAIYDLGYRGYDGPRLGRPAAVSTVSGASLRAAFGLKRSGRAKIVPWGLSAFMVAPAGVVVAISALVPGAPTPFSYDDYLWNLGILVAIFVAAQAPELVSSDQRQHVLSLYFSHALLRSDYALAKLGAFAAALFALALVPMLVLFVGRVLLAADVPQAFSGQLENLPQVIGAPLIFALPLAALGMAIACYTPRRAYATGAIIAVFIVTAAVGAILGEETSGTLARLAPLIDLFVVIDGTRDWLVGASVSESPVHDSGLALWWFGAIELAVVLVGTAVVVWRYRRIAA
jgi:ABC-2 type transport system permease protein